MKAYDGSLLIVSHDRDFLDGLTDKFYEFENGRVREHLETISEFLEKRKIDSLHELDRKNKEIASQDDVKQSSVLSYQQQKELSKQQRAKQNKIKSLEGEIASLEDQVKGIEEFLADPPEGTDIMAKTQEYLELKKSLDSKTEEWFSLQ
ncbi:MAG TPA: hypothetical protein DHU75_00195 [Rikenellaceae bacterium]|nr:hypothetical protein [Rikenellaceae bacterium]